MCVHKCNIDRGIERQIYARAHAISIKLPKALWPSIYFKNIFTVRNINPHFDLDFERFVHMTQMDTTSHFYYIFIDQVVSFPSSNCSISGIIFLIIERINTKPYNLHSKGHSM